MAASSSVANYTAAGSSSATGGYSPTASSSALVAHAPTILSSSYTSAIAVADNGYYSEPARSGVRRVPGIGSTLDNWIQGLDHSGDYWYGEENGIWYFYENELRTLYGDAIANGDLPAGTTWDKFLEWFNGQSSKYQFYSAPLSDDVEVLCVFALLYVVFALIKQYANSKEYAKN